MLWDLNLILSDNEQLGNKSVALFYNYDNYKLKIEEIADNNKWIENALVANEKLWTNLSQFCTSTFYNLKMQLVYNLL